MSNNILVTGCSKGLGLEICKTLLLEGNNVYGVSRTITTELEELKKNTAFKYLSFDLMNTDNVQNKLFKNWISNKIPLHGFVNNAAFAYDDLITNINNETLNRMFAINVLTPFAITKYAIRNMLFNRTKGGIIHVSSISVHTGYKGLAMYAASKGALEAFSKNTAREWGGRGLRSNCIVSGFMDTDMSSKLGLELKNRIYKRTALKTPTSLKCVSDTVAFLLSKKAESITGQNIFIDSGTI